MKAPELELKLLSNHFKNSYIETEDILHLEEEKLIMLLYEYKETIESIIANTKGMLHILIDHVGITFPHQLLEPYLIFCPRQLDQGSIILTLFV